MAGSKKVVKKAKKKTTRKAPVKAPTDWFIVTWDENGDDPVQVFDTLKKAQTFCTALITRNQELCDTLVPYVDVDDYDEGSLKIYQGRLLGEPKVSVSFD